eukprot:jgi/Mesvir1/26091/Mv06811-RA.1
MDAQGSSIPPVKPIEGKEVPKAVNTEATRLKSKDDSEVALGLVALYLLSSRPEAEQPLLDKISLFVPHIGSRDVTVKRNALALINAMLNQTAELAAATSKQVLKADGVRKVVAILNDAAVDEDTLLNAVTAVASLCRSGTQALDAVVAANGIPAALALLDTSRSATILEAAADVLCTLAAHPPMRAELLREGGLKRCIPFLAGGVPEVVVRVLLGLGMLVGDSLDAQAALAAEEGSIAALVSLARSEETDIKQIAASIFASLAKNPTLRPAVMDAVSASAA